METDTTGLTFIVPLNPKIIWERRGRKRVVRSKAVHFKTTRQPSTVQTRAEDHLGLAHDIASKFLRRKFGVKDSEVYSDSLLGLADAVRSYDPSHGPFKYYAPTCIANRIKEGLRNRARHNAVQFRDPEKLCAYASEQKLPVFSMIEAIFANQPDESSKDRRNKKILKMRYLDQMTWEQIGKRFGFTKAGAKHCANVAINKIRIRFPDFTIDL